MDAAVAVLGVELMQAQARSLFRQNKKHGLFAVLFTLMILATISLPGCKSEKAEEEAREKSYQALSEQRKAEDRGAPITTAEPQNAAGN